ncbi:MAG: peptidase M28, partial [Gammaproteobacteria bacterium]
MKHARLLLGALLPLMLVACGQHREKAAMNQIDAKGLASHIKVLASDDFGGREPATPGEDKSIHYIADQFKAMGLAPGNGD